MSEYQCPICESGTLVCKTTNKPNPEAKKYICDSCGNIFLKGWDIGDDLICGDRRWEISREIPEKIIRELK